MPIDGRQNLRSGGNPNWAAVLTWLVPGAGHLYLGRPVLALLGFALVEGIYLLGLQLSQGMTFEYLDLELRSLFAPVLAPETGNLGGFFWQLRTYGFGPGFPREFPEWMRLGSWLTGLSGILNVCLMVQAHVDARLPRESALPRPGRFGPALHVLLAWIVPGLGHLAQGRRMRGVLVFAALVGLFAFGTVLAEGSNLSRERHFYYWSGQFLVGAPAMIAEALWGGMRVRKELPYVDCGLVFGCVAGLLNVLALIDVFGWSEARLFGWPQKQGAAAEKQAAAALDQEALRGRGGVQV